MNSFIIKPSREDEPILEAAVARVGGFNEHGLQEAGLGESPRYTALELPRGPSPWTSLNCHHAAIDRLVFKGRVAALRRAFRPHAPSVPMRIAPAYFLCKWGV